MGSKGPVPAKRRRTSRFQMEPSRRGAAHACRVVVSTPSAHRPPARPTDLTPATQSRMPARRPATTEEPPMAMYWKEITVNWGESDPFGLVYYPRIVAWFNDTEHELFRVIGYPIEQMIKNDRTTFVMGEIHFRFIGPAAYGDRIVN